MGWKLKRVESAPSCLKGAIFSLQDSILVRGVGVCQRLTNNAFLETIASKFGGEILPALVTVESGNFRTPFTLKVGNTSHLVGKHLFSTNDKGFEMFECLALQFQEPDPGIASIIVRKSKQEIIVASRNGSA
jgi:hypothetical protein